MAACEWCWRQAQRRALLCGGAVADRYIEIIAEQEAMAPSPTAPGMRAAATQNLTSTAEDCEDRST